ncbi:coenzyme Q-binding protein COQ10 homolog B, mitochondrial-like [Bufo gargarizans]|uniref:coenzyme Q-binding protein COQ10 homolog B, mitochondrial-like n=1 Tax=Bufo gargarizans TaxID=30331 RepID=UPI001CF5BE1C|nr:coenzyme Q-binding protein COQ10 homolog B, mitochondrial-like [Bufo gargarizans]
MAGHCGRSTSALLRALLEAERGPCHAALRRAGKQHGLRHLNSCGILASQCTRLPLPSPVHVQTRSFLNLVAPILGSKRIDYTESKVLGYSIDQMFDIVANVKDYKMFVPWCNSSKVLSCRNGVTRAELEVGFPPIVERYISEIFVKPNHQIRAVCSDGKLFSHLETVWRFGPGLPGRPDTCTLDFFVSFEFKSLLHSHLATVFFDEVAKQMVTAFENQAARTYGQQDVSLRAAKRRAVQ